jgi:hypothetical protein
MFALLLSLALSATPTSSKPAPAVELPGLSLRWGMLPDEVAKQVSDFSWVTPQEADGGGMAGGRAQVGGAPATLMFQFGRRHLAVVMVVFDVPDTKDMAAGYAAVSRTLRARLGSPTATERNPPGEAAVGKATTERLEQWKVRGTEITHVYGTADGALLHSIHASDRRRPDYGQPSPDYEYR